ncbi:MAG TPA: hypothetical protein VGC53_16740, partial [Vicinamibacteria bacterium]
MPVRNRALRRGLARLFLQRGVIGLLGGWFHWQIPRGKDEDKSDQSEDNGSGDSRKEKSTSLCSLRFLRGGSRGTKGTKRSRPIRLLGRRRVVEIHVGVHAA